MNTVDLDRLTGAGCGPGGMSLLDWFAGQLACGGVSPDNAYLHAAALMVARRECREVMQAELKQAKREAR